MKKKLILFEIKWFIFDKYSFIWIVFFALSGTKRPSLSPNTQGAMAGQHIKLLEHTDSQAFRNFL